MRKTSLLLAIVAAGAALAAAASSATAQDLKPWRQAMILPKADAGFFLMAAKRGFAEREGLKVDVLEVKDDPIGMKALLSGEVDSYEGVYGAIAASARGADVKLLGCNWHAAPYVMLARPGIGSMRSDISRVAPFLRSWIATLNFEPLPIGTRSVSRTSACAFCP